MYNEITIFSFGPKNFSFWDNSKDFFCLNQLILLYLTNLEEISQLSQTVWNKGKAFI